MIREIWASLKHWWSAPLDKIEALDIRKNGVEFRMMCEAIAESHAPSVTQIQVKDFAVTGTPRHIPWSRRKKELEQAARQKRRQLESFREEA